MTQSQNAALRESAFKLFAGSHILETLQIDDMIGVLKGGLEDGESVDVGCPLFPIRYE